jgi:broad specificity phosphatase PhoE
VIFVRHGRAVVQPDAPADEWPLDSAYVEDIVVLRTALPDLPVVCSDARRAVETAQFFGEPTIDPNLREVSRPWTDDLDGCIERYLRGEAVIDWEPCSEARARIAGVVEQRGRAIYVSHGTALSLYLADVVPDLDAVRFWNQLRSPDAWQLDENGLVRLSAGGD